MLNGGWYSRIRFGFADVQYLAPEVPKHVNAGAGGKAAYLVLELLSLRLSHRRSGGGAYG
jgi:hypothetical protein